MAVIDCHDKANETPLRACQEALEAINKVHKAFGAPGDYGYGTKEGDALHHLYASAKLLSAVITKIKGDATTQGI